MYFPHLCWDYSLLCFNPFQRRNGGVPQSGNLTEHLKIYRQHVEELVPDKLNSGLVIIDFESWRFASTKDPEKRFKTTKHFRPIFRQNFGALQSYKDVSYQIEKQRHPFWQRQRQEAEVLLQNLTLCLLTLIFFPSARFFFSQIKGWEALRVRWASICRGNSKAF